MSSGSFIVSLNSNGEDIEIAPKANVKIPEDQENFAVEIGYVSSTIHKIYGGENLKKSIENLYFIAKMGLEGANAQPKLAKKALVLFKNDVLDEKGAHIKTKNVKTLGLYAIINSSFLILIIVLMGLIPNTILFPPAELGFVNLITKLSILLIGTQIGTWLSYALSKSELTFEDLKLPSSDYLNPGMKLLIVSFIALIFGLIFITGIINIDVNGLSTSNFLDNIIFALVLGVFLGLSEQTLGSKLSSNAQKYFENL